MMKRILLGLAFCAAASPALAEDGGVVGKLVTPNGTPIKGYPVVVSGKTESGLVQDWISATDSTGTFMVNALPPGQYTFAPANEPSATTNFSIEPATTPSTNLGAIQVAPGAKF